MSYFELRCKSAYSFLRGASQPEELILEAQRLGLRGIGLCDLNGVYGIPKAYHTQKTTAPELKLICGAQVTLDDHPPITLLTQNRKAYGLLCRLLTESFKGKEKQKASLPFKTFLEWSHREEASGLFALPEENFEDTSIEYGKLRDVFQHRLSLPLGRFLDGKDRVRTQKALTLSKKYDLSIVASNDVHFHAQSKQQLQDVLTSIRIGKPLHESGFALYQNGERYLKSPQQMKALFSDLPRAIQRTVEIAEACTFCPSELRYRYPSEWLPKNHTSMSFLRELSLEGLKKRYPHSVPDAARNQLEHELSMIAQLQFADYFLTIYDIVTFARDRGILCQGRGSAANSVVCFCLGITAIDPIQMELLFERFLSLERGEPPDIDVDFEHERREEVIQYIYEKYGRDRAAMISAVVTYRRRSALREVAKALGVQVGTLAAKKIDLDEEVKKYSTPFLKEKIEALTQQIKGIPRHLSIHSGGFTLSADPITEIVPVEPASMEGRTIIQWDKYDLDYLGLLKVDILSLGILSALNKGLTQIGMQLHEVPQDDPKTYQMIQAADTVGTFQIESRAQMSMLGRLQPKNFYDLVIEVAIVRPGPIVGKMVHPYLRRRRGDEPVIYPDPRVEAILGKTLGIPLFQEQVMKLAISLAGFTPGESDELRRAIGAWRSSGSIEKIGRRLMQGLLQSGLSHEFAAQTFDQIQGFAMYGFPESHAASFALLAYASCYLKCHHPTVFCWAMINSQPLGFYANHTLVDDAKRNGVRVLPVHPEHSESDCTLEGGALRLGWRVIQGISQREIESILAGRPYAGLSDFLAKNKIRKNILIQMAMGGVFECFGVLEREAVWLILKRDLLCSPGHQLSLFENYPIEKSEDQPKLRPFTPMEQLQEDYKTSNLSIRAHPMEVLRKRVRLPPWVSSQIKELPHGRLIQTAGLTIIKQRPPTAKGVTFVTLEDEFGFIDLIIHGETYERHSEIVSTECFWKVQGLLQRDRASASILVKKISPIRWGEKENLNIEPVQYFW